MAKLRTKEEERARLSARRDRHKRRIEQFKLAIMNNERLIDRINRKLGDVSADIKADKAAKKAAKAA